MLVCMCACVYTNKLVSADYKFQLHDCKYRADYYNISLILTGSISRKAYTLGNL